MPKLVNTLNQKKPKITIFAAKRTYLAIGLLSLITSSLRIWTREKREIQKLAPRDFDIPYFKFGYYSTMISIISKLLFTLLLWVLFLFLVLYAYFNYLLIFLHNLLLQHGLSHIRKGCKIGTACLKPARMSPE